jgi:DNA-binding IclR family transcriptional regulator
MPPYPKRKRRVITSVQRAINILDVFNNQRQELGITEIAHILDLQKSTVSGLIYTLESNGYLYRNPENRRYRLGYKLAERGGLIINQDNLRKIALPYQKELRDWCNESVNLAICVNNEVLYIGRLVGTNTLGMRVEVGKREFVHSTALGKAIMSWLPDEEVEEYIQQYGLERISPKTIIDPQRFIEELKESQERGFAIDDEENELGGRCVASAIFNNINQPFAAISISAPIQRMPDSKMTIYGERIYNVARKISHQLGSSLFDDDYDD